MLEDCTCAVILGVHHDLVVDAAGRQADEAEVDETMPQRHHTTVTSNATSLGHPLRDGAADCKRSPTSAIIF